MSLLSNKKARTQVATHGKTLAQVAQVLNGLLAHEQETQERLSKAQSAIDRIELRELERLHADQAVAAVASILVESTTQAYDVFHRDVWGRLRWLVTGR